MHYVALGDSYSSGVGAGSYIGSSGSCDQSTNAYPALWDAANQPASYVSEACSGATTATVLSSQLSALSAATTLVSITVGGNDVGFSSVMETCVLESTSSCVSAVNHAESLTATQLPGELDSVLSAIKADAPNARVVVLDYPELYDLSQSSSCIGLSTTDRTDLNQGADQLDSQIQAAAARHGDVFADVRGGLHRPRDLRFQQLAALGQLPGRLGVLPPHGVRPVRRLRAGLQRLRRLTEPGRPGAGGRVRTRPPAPSGSPGRYGRR